MANPILSGSGGVSPQSIYDDSTTQHHAIGQKGTVGDRTFYYASNTGAAIAKSVLLASAAPVANHVSVAWASGGAAGDFTATVTLGATAATLNQYRDGWFVVIDGVGSGQIRRIKSHPAADASATLALTFYDPIETALGAGEVSLIVNEYAGVRITPGNAGVNVIGVTPCEVAAGSTTVAYFWCQTGGPCMISGDGSTFVIGETVTYAIAGTADAGQCTITTGTTTTGQPVLGQIIDLGDAASDLDHRFVNLNIRQ